jgi:NACalpha-BTF3-like transcription factor
MESLDQIVEHLTTATGDLELLAKFSPVDANEVAQALQDAEPDSAESVVLRLLAKHNPLPQL